MIRWWRRRSIRLRLTLWHTGALAGILLLYSGGVFVFVWRNMAAELDRRLREDFEIAEAMLSPDDNGAITWRVAHPHDEEELDEQLLVEVWSPDGSLLFRSESAAFLAGVIPPPLDGAERLAAVSWGDERRARYLESAETIGGTPAIIRVIRSEARYRQTLGRLALIESLGLPIGVAIAAVGGYALARRSLAPVASMTEQARTITADRLSDRLVIENPSDELGRLAQVFNDMFSRLGGAFDQLKRFTADASHELRTPLTSIRSVGEVALRDGGSAEAHREAIGSMLEDIDRLSHLVDALLVLSRADAGPVRLTREPMDLSALAQRIVDDLVVLAEERRQTLLVDAPAAVVAPVDGALLRQAVMNLVDNAIKYSPAGATIRIEVTRRNDAAAIAVHDEGAGIAPEDQPRIFDRFYRVDKARSREMGGAGLGLSIARWVVEAHGGRLELETEEGRGSTFRINLPIDGRWERSGEADGDL